MSDSSPSVAHLWLDRVASTPDALAFEYREDGRWTGRTWSQAGARVRRIALGLQALGISPGDRCAILCSTRIEWILCDMAILCAGAAVSTIYPSNPPDDCAYILEDSGAVLCVCEDRAQLAKLRAVPGRLGSVAHIVLIDHTELGDLDGPDVHTLDELEALGVQLHARDPDCFEARARAVGPQDLATLIYTSGTTGPPKGVMLTHDCWVYQGEAIEESTRTMRRPDDKQYLFLPLSHSFGKVLELYAIALGVPTAVDGDIEGLLGGLAHTRPTFMAAVPRVFEKVHNTILVTAKEAGRARYAVFQWALGVGMGVAEARIAGRSLGRRQRLKYRIANKLVFDKLRAAFGGRMRVFVSGGAPLAPDIARFFYAADMLVLEGYGLTETSAGAVGNSLEVFRFGTVGRPIPGTEVRIAPDGEVLLRSRGVMKGYWNRPEATDAALEDGWLHTGDLGSIDVDGFLKITGRSKDLIITAGGKNISPQNIENQVKGACPYVSEVVLHGDKRNYCTALVCIDEEATGRWAAERGLTWSGYADLASKPEVSEEIWRHVDKVNRSLAPFETIKKLHLLDHELTQESGELTPSLKVKRSVVEANYKHILDAFYEGTVAKL